MAIALAFFAADELALDSDSTPEPDTSQKIVATVAQHTIAVLPFVNMSSDPEQEYFSDGLSEEILNLLAKIPELKVIGRTSSFAFKGKNQDLRIIGETLGANTVLEGSVRKSGERVRITAQLIDVADGTHIWSDTYDRTITDIFAVQDDVAAAIIDALQIHVGAVPSRGRPTANAEAYTLFLKARVAMNAFEFENAELILREAVELDPDFAEAYELLAYTYWWLAGFSVKGADGQRLMNESASAALAINPDLIFARVLSQDTETYTWQVEVEGLESVLREQPNNALALDGLTYDLLEAGYLAEALEITERWIDVDPLSPAANVRHYESLVAAGRRSDGVAALQLAAELGSRAADWEIAIANLEEGRDEVAIDQFESIYQKRGYPDVSWVSELINGSRDSDAGQALLDRRIPEIVATMGRENAYEMQRTLNSWYLPLGFLDRFVEITDEGRSVEFSWSDSDNYIFEGTIWRNSGFTAHPKYVEIARQEGIVGLWEHRGPPDFCEKIGGEWVCE
jgi:TolB-like protein